MKILQIDVSDDVGLITTVYAEIDESKFNQVLGEIRDRARKEFPNYHLEFHSGEGVDNKDEIFSAIQNAITEHETELDSE